MKWIALHNKIGKQPVRITRRADVTVVIDDIELEVIDIKFKADGAPYLIVKSAPVAKKDKEIITDSPNANSHNDMEGVRLCAECNRYPKLYSENKQYWYECSSCGNRSQRFESRNLTKLSWNNRQDESGDTDYVFS